MFFQNLLLFCIISLKYIKEKISKHIGKYVNVFPSVISGSVTSKSFVSAIDALVEHKFIVLFFILWNHF